MTNNVHILLLLPFDHWNECRKFTSVHKLIKCFYFTSTFIHKNTTNLEDQLKVKHSNGLWLNDKFYDTEWVRFYCTMFPCFTEDVLWSNIAQYWSPNGRYLCYAKFNMTDIPLMKIPVYGSADQMYPDIMELAYPKVITGIYRETAT